MARALRTFRFGGEAAASLASTVGQIGLALVLTLVLAIVLAIVLTLVLGPAVNLVSASRQQSPWK